MANISKINALALANIAKVDAITKANIAKVNGLDLPSGAVASEPYLAYSVRKLGAGLGITYSGPCMRIARVSDNVEADVGFDGDTITLNSAISNTTASESTLGAFVGHGGTPTDAKVKVWYDQSSTGNNAEWRTSTSAFRIYSSASGLETLGGEPCLNGAYQSLSALFTASSFTISTDNNAGYYLVADHASSSNSDYAFGYYSGIEGLRVDRYYGGVSSPQYTNTGGQVLFSAFTEGSAASVYMDGTLANSATSTGTKSTVSTQLVIGGRGPYIYDPYDGYVQEFLMYRSSAIAERATVESNINGHFGIY